MVPYKKYTGGNEVFSGINIVPFTDIVLVLLIIFMIAAPGLVSTGLNISLPGATTTDPSIPSKVTVGLDNNGNIFLEGQRLSREDLGARIKELVARRDDLGVVLNADRHAEHGNVIALLDTLRRAGARKIYVGTVKE